jgi:hypothetical protein
MSEAHDPQEEFSSLEEFESWLDKKPIPEQVAWMVDAVENAHRDLLVAHWVAQKIGTAHDAGVLKPEEGERFAETVRVRIKDLQAMLVIQWSGRNSDREILEQLHHIYWPHTRPDGGLGYTLDDDLRMLRTGVPFEVLLQDMGVREGLQRQYWNRLVQYAEKHPDEPVGWRERRKKD